MVGTWHSCVPSFIVLMIDLFSYDFFAFDLDGTLVNSHHVYKEKDRLYVKYFYNKNVSEFFLEQFESMFREKVNKKYSVEYYLFLDKLFGDGRISAEEVFARLSWIDESVIKPRIKFRTGAVSVLKTIKKMCPQKKFLLVTGSKRQEVEYFCYNPLSALRESLDISTFFDCIITKDDTILQKPAPEPYKKALGMVGAQKGATVLVFEDSIEGVLSAKANNATVIAIENNYFQNTDVIKKVADYFFKDWEEFLNSVRF